MSLKDNIKINGALVKNCVKVVGIGKTSYNPGPPLDNINITVKINRWYYPGLGLIKMTREESSDSETMGSVFYEKTINFWWLIKLLTLCAQIMQKHTWLILFLA